MKLGLRKVEVKHREVSLDLNEPVGDVLVSLDLNELVGHVLVRGTRLLNEV